MTQQCVNLQMVGSPDGQNMILGKYWLRPRLELPKGDARQLSFDYDATKDSGKGL